MKKKLTIFGLSFALIIGMILVSMGDIPTILPIDIALNTLLDVNVPDPTDGYVLTYDIATRKWIDAVGGGGGADEKVKIDAAATAGYLGAAYNDGVLRADENELTYTDGGDNISIGLADHATARTALGLAIDSDVQAYDTDLDTLAGSTAWRIFYSNATSIITELALGTSGQYLKANGTTSAPTWDTPAGGGGTEFTWESVRLSGRYYSSNVVNDPMGSMSVLNADKGYAMPFLVPCQQSFDRIGIVVQTAGDAISKIRLGIYADNGSCYPGALVVDSGELAADTNGFKEANITETLDAGLYWLVCNSNGDEMSSMTVKTFDYWRCMSPLGWSSPLTTTSYTESFYTKDSMAYGALPNPFPAGAALTKDSDVRAIFLRR